MMKPDLACLPVSNVLSCEPRPASSLDSGRIADLATQLGYECTEEQIRNRLDEMSDKQQYAIFVAELPNGEIAGWIGLQVLRAVEVETSVEITGLVVDEQFRSRKVGRRLLEAAENWTRSKGHKTILVRSNIARSRAHRFYLQEGYKHTKTQANFTKELNARGKRASSRRSFC
jgi:GNAT superfamily N-acetyltransferase